jgi:glycosyltransferase involved in cell wall biosynthesis
MASGCPVVTSNGGAIPEVVADAAVMFDPFDSKTAADAVVKILNDAKTAQLLAIRGLERAKKFDWHKIAEQTASVYKLVLGKE